MSEEKTIYSIGQKLTFKEDAELEKGFGAKVTVKKGTAIFIGADSKRSFAHYLNGDIQPLSENSEVKGYSVSGLAEWIYEWVSRELPLDEMLEDYDETKERFVESVADALEELGMYDATGNRM